MNQPKGFIDPEKPNYMCKLHNAIYILKQASIAWFDTLKGALVSRDFTIPNQTLQSS